MRRRCRRKLLCIFLLSSFLFSPRDYFALFSFRVAYSEQSHHVGELPREVLSNRFKGYLALKQYKTDWLVPGASQSSSSHCFLFAFSHSSKKQ